MTISLIFIFKIYLARIIQPEFDFPSAINKKAADNQRLKEGWGEGVGIEPLSKLLQLIQILKT
ncbi:MAG: hypothetical protein BGO55_30785 [Sphingobacteriales bacterium 50-39]|nr:MAG: hypothetical protein BGO55_30785 [Sphingobacteriales bacterium 50-39]